MKDALGVDQADIARMHPAFGVEGFAGQLVRLEIPPGGAVAPHQDFSGLAGLGVSAVFAQDADFHLQDRPTTGAQAVAFMILGPQHGQGQGRFGLTVILPELVLTEAGHGALDHRARHGRGAVDDPLQRRQITAVQLWALQQHLQHGRYKIDRRRAVPLDRGEESVWRETGQDDAASAPHPQGQDEGAAGVDQRSRVQHHVFRPCVEQVQQDVATDRSA